MVETIKVEMAEMKMQVNLMMQAMGNQTPESSMWFFEQAQDPKTQSLQ